MSLNGPASQARIPGYDLMFSVPKSASLLFGLGDARMQSAVLRAQDQAVGAALAHLETWGCRTRRGRGGAEVVAGGGFIGAAFRHRTSRAGDPQIHSHVLVSNATLRDDGQWGALDGRALFAEARTAGFVHEAAFRRELTRELGVEWGPVKKGIADVVGFTPTVLRAFSRRRQELEVKLAEWGRDGLEARQAAAVITRDRKDHQVTPEMLAPEWRERAAAMGVNQEQLQRVVGRALPGPANADERALLVERLIGESGLTAHRSTFDRRDLMREVAAASRAGATLDELEDLCAEVLRHPSVVACRDREGATNTIRRKDGRLVSLAEADGRFTTVDLLALERGVLEGAAARQGEDAVVASVAAIETAIAGRPSLGPDQAAMVQRLCTEGDGVVVVLGPPGTVKTFALDAAREAWQESGFHVRGAAVARRAARGLHEGAGIDSTSVAALLKDLDRGLSVLDDRSVLVVDEAGMLGTRQLATLLDHARAAGTKVVLVGDHHQLPEIEAGGAFRALADSLRTVELDVNRRQREPHAREMLIRWRAGAIDEALAVAIEHDEVVMSANADALRDRLVDDYLAAAESGDAVMIALRRADVRDLNARARKRLDAAGLLGPERLQSTCGEFALGDRVICKRNDRRLGVDNGDSGVVERIEGATLVVRLGPDRAAWLDAGYLDAPGEPALVHGYACTAHVMQGATTDHAFILGSDFVYREWGYTAWSRARQSTRYYVCEPAAAVDEHHSAAPAVHQPWQAALERSRAEALALEDLGEDAAPARAAAARHHPPPHVVASLGRRPDAPVAARRWDAAVLLFERARHALRVPAHEAELGARPAAARERMLWLKVRAQIQRAARGIGFDRSGREHDRNGRDIT